MSRSASIVVAAIAFACAAAVLAFSGADPARAAADRWGLFAFAALVPALAAVGFFPGWFALARARLLGTWTRISFAVFVSLAGAAAVGALATALGVSFAWPARALAVVTLCGATVSGLAALRGRARSVVDGDEAPESAGGVAALVVLGFVLLVAGLYVVSPELRPRDDGWFHAAVAARVAQVGVPPDDPWYAGLPLHYAWAMHLSLDVLVAGAPRGTTVLGMLAGWPVLGALALAASVVAAGMRWARAAGDARSARAAGAWALGLAAFAVHPLGFWIWCVDAFVGHVRGWNVFVRPMADGAGAVLQALASNLPHPSLAFFPDKFLIPTAFGLAYATVITALDALFLATWSTATRILVAATAILVTLLFHPLAGASLVAALVVAAAIDLARGRGASAFATLVACAGALLVAAPYLFVVLRGREGGAGPWVTFAPDMLMAVLVTGCALIALAVPELRRAGGVLAAGRARLGLIALVWLVAAVGLGIVQRNETKFVSLGLLALAVPAGAWAALHPRVATLALAVALPGVIAAVLGFARDGGQESLGARLPSSAVAAGYAWVAGNTATRDVFLEAQAKDRRDPVRDLLVHGPRPLVWGGDSYASNWGYPAEDLARRKQASRELADGAVSEASARWLAERFAPEGRSVFAVRRPPAPPRAYREPAPMPGPWTRVYDGPGFSLDRLELRPSLSPSAGAR